MKIALIGASGFTGTRLLQEALQRGHSVTAIVRNPEKIRTTHPALDVVKSDVLDKSDLAARLQGHDIVISAYNAGWDNPNLYRDFLEGSNAIQQAVKDAGVPRLLVIGGAGSLEVEPGVQLVDTHGFPEAYKSGATAARDYLNILKEEQSIDWTFFSPAIEMHPGIDTGRTGQYRTGTDQPVFDAAGHSRLSAEDLAVAVLDETERPAFLRRRFTAAY